MGTYCAVTPQAVFTDRFAWVSRRVKTGFSKKPNPLGFFKNQFFKKPGIFRNPILVDFGDVLLGFEGFKNKPHQWVLEV